MPPLMWSGVVSDLSRELAYQISQQVTSLGSTLGVRTAVLVGGLDMMSQSIALSKRPHILVATPGRLMDHLENTKGFSLKGLKYLVSRPLLVDFFPAHAPAFAIRFWTRLIDCSTWTLARSSTRYSRSYRKSGTHIFSPQR